MTKTTHEQLTPQYSFGSEEIAHVNANETDMLAHDYIEKHGGYIEMESGDPSVALVQSDQARAHAKQVQQGVKDMYEDAYAEHKQRSADGEK